MHTSIAYTGISPSRVGPPSQMRVRAPEKRINAMETKTACNINLCFFTINRPQRNAKSLALSIRKYKHANFMILGFKACSVLVPCRKGKKRGEERGGERGWEGKECGSTKMNPHARAPQLTHSVEDSYLNTLNARVKRSSESLRGGNRVEKVRLGKLLLCIAIYRSCSNPSAPYSMQG
jgi:hypothetical protein